MPCGIFPPGMKQNLILILPMVRWRWGISEGGNADCVLFPNMCTNADQNGGMSRKLASQADNTSCNCCQKPSVLVAFQPLKTQESFIKNELASSIWIQ